jgi:hypothetical protein
MFLTPCRHILSIPLFACARKPQRHLGKKAGFAPASHPESRPNFLHHKKEERRRFYAARSQLTPLRPLTDGFNCAKSTG